MSIYHLILLGASIICFIACTFHFMQIFLLSRNREFAMPRGKVSPAIKYSFTGAMSPFKKETAYRHFPTYTAGIIFHLGTFLSFFWLIFHFFNIYISQFLNYSFAFFIAISSICGLSILIKRIVIKKLRFISNPDDYASNILVTGFQIISALTIIWNQMVPILFIYASVLFLYLPLGKLRHTVYFFSSRIHLGIFFGRRGTWPLKR